MPNIVRNGIDGIKRLFIDRNDSTFAEVVSIVSSDNGLTLPTVVFSGRRAVVTANVAVALAASRSIKSLAITALDTNTAPIFVGGSDVTAANGYPLKPDATICFDVANLATIFIVGATPGEGVAYLGVA